MFLFVLFCNVIFCFFLFGCLSNTVFLCPYLGGSVDTRVSNFVAHMPLSRAG